MDRIEANLFTRDNVQVHLFFMPRSQPRVPEVVMWQGRTFVLDDPFARSFRETSLAYYEAIAFSVAQGKLCQVNELNPDSEKLTEGAGPVAAPHPGAAGLLSDRGMGANVGFL